jgi:hypothetical protein|tara:strand:+ start:2524 stop:3474 length:951 start_codon:yes stop_codon:yes gene_type:complete
MTTFFNQKEEVINVELTPYGKHKFSQGEFRPEFYSFYDSDILYEGTYGGLTEIQNNIVSRIKEGTPYIKPLVSFTSSLAQVRYIDVATSQFDTISDNTVNFYKPLGRNSPWSEYKPAWLLYTVSDSVQLSHAEGTSSGFGYSSQGLIPILSASVIDIKYSTLNMEPNVEDPEDQPPVYVLESDQEGRFYIDLLELNTIFKVNGNYDIEIFRVPIAAAADDVISLSFIDEQVDYGDNLANQATDPYSYLNSLAGDDIEQRQNFPRLTKDYVEYFLSVRIDEQIVDMPQITPGQGLYVSPQKTPEIICSDINAYGTDR